MTNLNVEVRMAGEWLQGTEKLLDILYNCVIRATRYADDKVTLFSL
jgi:hypothetical protein